MASELEKEIATALNRCSAENPSNTPDFILAQFLLGCLAAWNTGVQQRETWYGRDASPTEQPYPPPPSPRAAAAIRLAEACVALTTVGTAGGEVWNPIYTEHVRALAAYREALTPAPSDPKTAGCPDCANDPSGCLSHTTWDDAAPSDTTAEGTKDG